MFAIKIISTLLVAVLLISGLSAWVSGRVPVAVLGLSRLPRPRWWGAGAVMTCAGALVSLWVAPEYGYGLPMVGVGLATMARRPYPQDQQPESPSA
jgi:hypothetical protein